MKEVDVFSTRNQFVIRRLSSILKEQNIDFKTKETGEAKFDIETGKDLLPKQTIIVDREDYKRVKNLIDFLNIKEDKEEIEKEKEKKNSFSLKAIPVDEFGNRKYSLATKIIISVLALLIIGFIAGLVFVISRYAIKP